MDKVPEDFEYGAYSVPPTITDQLGPDTLIWRIETLEENKEIQISYELFERSLGVRFTLPCY